MDADMTRREKDPEKIRSFRLMDDDFMKSTIFAENPRDWMYLRVTQQGGYSTSRSSEPTKEPAGKEPAITAV